MRILMLSWEYPPRIVGGISRVVYNLAQKLGGAGNEVHVVTCREEGTADEEKDINVFVHRVDACSIDTGVFINWVHQLNFSMLEKSIKLIRETGEFDIIHAHDWIVAFTARVLKHSFNIPLVSTIHATEYGRNWGIHNEMQRYISSVEWWLTYESWKVIVNSEFMKNEVANIFELPEDKIRIVNNGIELNKFEGLKRDYSYRKLYAADNEKIVFFVGRLVNEKGAQVLLEAAPKIISRYGEVRFVIAGKGPQLDYLQGKARELGISGRTCFTGYISDDELNRLYMCSDIAVFPSLYEPFGIVALEGMVAGVPVVVSDTGGMGEIVDHGVDGMKAYTGNADSLADSILELLFNPGMARRMSERAYQKVYENYSWDIIARHTHDIYGEILREKVGTAW